MTCVKYLCIDDQPEEYILPLLDQLSLFCDDLKFERMHPQDFALQFERIQGLANEGVYFGLLVDLRLDQDSDAEGNKVYYRGPTLAQELRTRMAEGSMSSFPIILWSMNDNIVRSYAPDSSSHDLFDAVYAKDDANHPLDQTVSCQLVALAVGYQKLVSLLSESANPSIDKVIGLLDGDRDYLDPRLISYLKGNAVYELAGKVLNTLLRCDGVLIDEVMLAAQLGVDIEQSGEQWIAFLEAVSKCQYSGVFHEAWPRWWKHRIEAFWTEFVSNKGSLRKYTADERVAILNEKIGVALIPAAPIAEGYSHRFSTVCVALKSPLDPVDGFKVHTPRQDAWQDSRYVSAHAVINRLKKSEWSLDPLEIDRFKQLMERLKNEAV
ncbi:hypothetical protein [Pseudomonas fragi]|uniref:hypothetical protein n=1 Tax=Pseudomonas fragi TaxID=296 RepID=UPI002D76DD77|nr:hypothetical protein [Pseudomonas fragi]WRT61578.1 hypothetical protein VK847_04290 [Pseudomonas fragi]